MLFNNPISIQKVDLIINALDLTSSNKVIDIGCGEGEFLKRLYQVSKSECLGIDLDLACIEKAKSKLTKEESHNIQFLEADIQKHKIKAGEFDLAVCIGSTHAFGMGDMAYSNSLKAMSNMVKPNGLILVGEGYWKRTPDKEYLDFIGDPVGIYNNHEENIKQAEALGLIPLYVTCSNQDEWDHFEWCFKMKAERNALAQPKNEAAQQKLKAVREWNTYYQKYGRTTMGFGFYLYLKP